MCRDIPESTDGVPWTGRQDFVEKRYFFKDGRWVDSSKIVAPLNITISLTSQLLAKYRCQASDESFDLYRNILVDLFNTDEPCIIALVRAELEKTGVKIREIVEEEKKPTRVLIECPNFYFLGQSPNILEAPIAMTLIQAHQLRLPIQMKNELDAEVFDVIVNAPVLTFGYRQKLDSHDRNEWSFIVDKLKAFPFKSRDTDFLRSRFTKVFVETLRYSPLQQKGCRKVLIPIPGSRRLQSDITKTTDSETRLGYIEELCQAATCLDAFDCSIDLIKSTKVRKPMHECSSVEERRENIAGAFQATSLPARFFDGLKKPLIILVDDIFTTGSTASEAIKALVAANKQHIDKLQIAVLVLGVSIKNDQQHENDAHIPRTVWTYLQTD